ncbi:MAG: hypothetical protein AAGF94_18605 [Pseudomonadota bacterium]
MVLISSRKFPSHGWLIGLPILLICACTTTTSDVPTSTDREAAEIFVATTITDQFPNYAFATPAADCVVDNALDSEILLLAGETGTATDRALTKMAMAVAQRPDTQACFQSKNLPRLS